MVFDVPCRVCSIVRSKRMDRFDWQADPRYGEHAQCRRLRRSNCSGCGRRAVSSNMELVQDATETEYDQHRTAGSIGLCTAHFSWVLAKYRGRLRRRFRVHSRSSRRQQSASWWWPSLVWKAYAATAFAARPSKYDHRLRQNRSDWRLQNNREHKRQGFWPSTGCRGPAESHEVSGFAARADRVLSVCVTQNSPRSLVPCISGERT